MIVYLLIFLIVSIILIEVDEYLYGKIPFDVKLIYSKADGLRDKVFGVGIWIYIRWKLKV